MRTTAGLAVVAFTAAACSTMPNDADPPDVHNDMAEPTDVAAIGRVDLQTTGNRVIDDRGSLGTAAPVIIDIGAEPEWIVAIEPIEPRPGMSSWLVVDEAGGLHRIDRIGEAATVSAIDGLVDPAAGPPLWADDRIVSSPDPRLDEFDTPLPDARIVTSADIGLTAVLTQPTDRYAHGVLGDDLEAAAVLVRDDVDVTIAFTEPDVAEAISPMLADVDADGELDVVVTLSNASVGARLAAYRIDGSLLSESEPIGRGNRWRNLLAVAPIGPSGEVEVIDVRTPHIGGTVQFFAHEPGLESAPGRLVEVASARGYTTHSIGSRNLDLGIVSDADGDGRLDVIVPTQDRRALHVVTRTMTTESGTEVVGTVEFEASITTNVGAQTDGERVEYAVGTRTGVVHLFPPA